jgi:hypothetical protein
MVAALTGVRRQLCIRISQNPGCKDHEARILIDGEDLLGADTLGLDPPDLARQLTRESPEIRIGRCACGTMGCDDVIAIRTRDAGTVQWHVEGRGIAFDEHDYDQEISRFLADRSWAPVERLAEFAVDPLFAGRKLEDRLEFDWSSGRIKRQVITLSFSDMREQRLLEFTWDGQTVDSATEGAGALLREHFEV